MVRAGIAQAKVELVLFLRLIGTREYLSRINMIYGVKQDNSKGEVNMSARFSSYVLGFRYFGLRQVFSACRPDL